MKIAVATRCLNGLEYIDRFVKGYDFADQIVVSEGGSDDGSVEKWMEYYPKVRVFKFEEFVMRGGYKWNPDNDHIQHAIDKAMEFEPDWLILDDLDDVPNQHLRESARFILEPCDYAQVYAFRLYMWGQSEYFPHMNRSFDPAYTSLWAWNPKKCKVWTVKDVKHGTLASDTSDIYRLALPNCLLHKSWHPDTIQQKIDRYNAIGLEMHHPLDFAGKPEPLPSWAVE